MRIAYIQGQSLPESPRLPVECACWNVVPVARSVSYRLAMPAVGGRWVDAELGWQVFYYLGSLGRMNRDPLLWLEGRCVTAFKITGIIHTIRRHHCQ